MPPVDQTEDTPKEVTTTSTATTKSVVGIIYPPPEVRNIVDKTASFVARNGLEFENRIRQNEINNPKFNFLNPNDPYHAYYQHKVKEFKEGKGQEPVFQKGSGLGLFVQQKQQDVAKIIEPVVPKEPPPEPEFIADPPSISSFDLDVVKLTAQFVARNGRNFLTNLMNREQRNYQFDFLRPQHSLFNYFTKLVEQYTKILIPPKDLLPKLRKESDNPKIALDQVKYRVDWAKYQEREKAKEEEEKEKERVAYAQIDWHDFVVVETVDFQPNETGNLPPPTTPDEVGARLLAQERFENLGDEAEAEPIAMEVVSGGESSGDEEEEEEEVKDKQKPETDKKKKPSGVDTTIQDMEEGSDDEQEGEKEKNIPVKPPPPPAPPAQVQPTTAKDRKEQPPQPPLPPPPPPKEVPQPPPLPPTPDQVIIKEYNPKATKPVESEPADKFLISPITGEKVPADKIQQHMHIELLAPEYIEEVSRKINEKREQEDVFAMGTSIDTTLKKLAERRTDIFGSGAEETQIGKKIGEEEEQKKSDKIIWDGHTASMEKVSQKARENITIETQIAAIHSAKGLVPDEEKEKIGPAPVPRTQPSSVSVAVTNTTEIPTPKTQMPPLPPPPQAPLVAKPPAKPSQPPKPPVSAPAPPPQPPQPPQAMTAPPRPVIPPPQPPVIQMGQPRMMMLPPRPPMPPMAPRPPIVAMQMPPHPSVMSLMPMGGPPQPPQAPQPPPPIQTSAPQQATKQPAKPSGDEPPAKKMKTEEDLMPEGEFLSKNPEGVARFRVAVPGLPDKSEWKCQGQMLELTLPLTDTVSVIKAKIHEAINMPVGKQKLQYDGLFIKDSNTLAFYNLGKQSVIQLQLKERGGRKK